MPEQQPPEIVPVPRSGAAEAPVLVKVAVGVAVAALLVAMMAFASSASGGMKMASDRGGTAAAVVTNSAGAATVEVVLGEMYVRPDRIEVTAGQELVLQVTNEGVMQHDLALDGTTGSRMLAPGESETVNLGVIQADAQAWCTVPGHKAAGMVMDIVVTGAHEGGTRTDTTGTGTAAEPASTETASISASAEPGPQWRPYDPRLAPAPSGTEHKLTLEAVDRLVEVSPGVTQLLWTFGGTVPGPVMRGKVGDLFTVTLVNKGSIGHSVDFHASRTPMDTDMRTLEPGESLVYQFKAEHSGIWMYHCGTPPVLHHIGNGMYGAVVIDPVGLPKMDTELLLVQSELYLGPPDKEMSLDKMLDDSPDAVVFNGYDRQYAFAPVTVPVGERVRIWVLVAGPSRPSAFHVIGTQFDTVFKEGAYLLRRGNAVRGGAQAIDLLPGMGGFVEMSFPKPGHYAFVSHRFVDAARGAIGTIVAERGAAR